MHSTQCIVFTYASLVTVNALVGSSRIDEMDSNCEGSPLQFDEFINVHERSYASGTEEYEMRRSIYNRRTAEISEHNCRQNRMWTAGVNKLTDRTEEELKVLRGYRSMPRKNSNREHATLLQSGDSNQLPREVSWQHLNAMQEIQDQGSCGSCWAFAAATVLRAHSEIYREDRKFSVQQIVSCTPNPRQCGGTGGCNGATAELAMEYVYKNGCVSQDQFPYTQSDELCPKNMQVKVDDVDYNGQAQNSFLQESGSGSGGSSFGMTGWTKLPENQVEPLMRALISGPVSVSVSAGYSWNSYWGGILNDCPNDAVIDHAVVLIAYGNENGVGYWTLQNSWGQDWGENGHIRILRKDDDEESNYCGWDNSPEVGSGCTGGPKKVYVCGMCGVLYDTVVPHFTTMAPKRAASSDIVLMSRNVSISKSLRVVKRTA